MKDFVFQNIDSGSRPENDYAESAGPAQDQPLLTETPPLPPRLMADGESTPLLHNVLGDPTYTPVLTTTPNAVSQPAATEKIRYEDIQKYRNKQVWFSTHLQMVILTVMWYPVLIFIVFLQFMVVGPGLCLTTIQGHVQERACR